MGSQHYIPSQPRYETQHPKGASFGIHGLAMQHADTLAQAHVEGRAPRFSFAIDRTPSAFWRNREYGDAVSQPTVSSQETNNDQDQSE